MFVRLSWRAMLHATLLSIASALPVMAQQWVPLDRSAAGTPAEVKLVREQSDADTTTLEVVLHGYYRTEKKGPDGQDYVDIRVPGLGKTTQRGAPDLPVVRTDIAIVNDAKVALLSGSRREGSQTLENILPYPKPIPAVDRPGSRDEFRRDEQIYSGFRVFPADDAVALHPTRAKAGAVKGVSVELHPFQYDPAKRSITFSTKMTVQFKHTGGAVRQVEVTRDRFEAIGSKFINSGTVLEHIKANLVLYRGDFLFIYAVGGTPSGQYRTVVQPLVEQKKARGFRVAEQFATTATCASIRTQIRNWYLSRSVSSDKYVLLVGDTNSIPLCSYNGTPTDDLYASTDGDDLDEEVFLGRLSASTPNEAAAQVAKILAYEDSPSNFCCYDKALLVAHKEGAPGKYVGAHESVRTATYAVPPVFSTLYGHLSGVDNSDVTNGINPGVGLVAYRGHGSDTAWTGWNLLSQNYANADVMGLANVVNRSPVVWSFACDNSDLNASDSIAEVWMSDPNNGAVSHYGSTIPSYTSQNHELDRQMFKAVYHLGLTTQSHAIQYAEAKMADLSGDDNAWMYLLLGDPEMKIRRRNPIKLVIIKPNLIARCLNCPFELKVYTEQGRPVPDTLVSVWKKSAEGRDEVLANGYTNADGIVRLAISPATTGELVYTVQDRQGGLERGTVRVQ